MTRNLLVLFFAAALTFSCSSDDNGDGSSNEDSIVGTWELSQLSIINEATAPDELLLAKDILDVFMALQCELITLTFNADGTLTTRSAAGDIDINNTGGGALIPCPDTFETETVSWSLEGDQLTITDSSGLEDTTTIQLNGDTLTVAGEDFEEESFTGADIVFQRN